VFTTKAGGEVDITIVIDQDDIGDQDFVIKEVVPTDSSADESIEYTASPVIASVTIGEVKAADNGGKAGVAATSEVAYTAQKSENGVPLMTNKYKASGSLILNATKELVSSTNSNEKETVRDGQFNFVVKEGYTQVATGTTKKGGQIEFTEIKYVAADIGTHTYTISEVKGDDVFVNYTASPVEVVVDVEDAGEGNLSAKVTKVGDTEVTGDSYSILFTNEFTFKVPTGISLNVLPYAMATVMAALGAMMLMRRCKRRCRRK
jgi:pilin isopeptide linkage protein